MKEADHFIKYFKDSLDDDRNIKKTSKDFFTDFIEFTPEIEKSLNNYIWERKMDLFYLRLNDLKYLCVFNEELNKYWFSMRALSGALNKLLNPMSVQHAHEVHQYYIEKYGDRRILKDENWFENRRWTFLDALGQIQNETQLSYLIDQNMVVLSGLLVIYWHHLQNFITNVKKAID